MKSRSVAPMRDYMLEERYEEELKKLKKIVSKKNYKDLDLFLVNSNLGLKQRDNLIKIISEIYSDGEFKGVHSSLNTVNK